MTQPTTDTSREAVEGLASEIDRVYLVGGSDKRMISDTMRALLTERDAALLREKALKDNTEELRQLRREFNALESERDEWMAAFGQFLSEVPLQDVLGASGSVQDAIDYFKAAIAERDALRDQLAAARDAALEEAALWAESEGLFRTRDEIRALKSAAPAPREVTVQEAAVLLLDIWLREGLEAMQKRLRSLSKEEKIDG